MHRNTDWLRSAKWGLFFHGERLHIFTFLGDWWGAGAPRFPDEFVVGYSKHISAQNGAVT